MIAHIVYLLCCSSDLKSVRRRKVIATDCCMELSSLESSSVCSETKLSQFDHTRVVKNLWSKKVFFEKSGAHCNVMPCHILHSWHNGVFKGCSVRSLHVGEYFAKELKEAKLKPLEAGSALRIGVLDTDATLKAGFYQEKLQNEMT